jgi:hypothetical protein
MNLNNTPQFNIGGGVDSTKVWTKRNKRARGMDNKHKEPKKTTIVSQPAISIVNQPRQTPPQVERQAQIESNTNPIVFSGNLKQKETGNELLVVVAKNGGERSFREMNISSGRIRTTSSRNTAMPVLNSKLKMRWWWKPPYPVSRGTTTVSPFSSLIFMMNGFKDFSVLSWNVRGFASKKSRNHMHELLCWYKPDMLILVETHIAFAFADTFWRRENYEKIDIHETQGHFGGIWVMQRRGSDFGFTPVSKMYQCVSVIVSKGNVKWLFSGVYASPVYTARPVLWQYLENLSKDNLLPWLVMGDFNDILLPKDQRGGVFSVSKADVFATNIDSCGLLDLGSFGSKFTWQCHCRGGRIVHRGELTEDSVILIGD